MWSPQRRSEAVSLISHPPCARRPSNGPGLSIFVGWRRPKLPNASRRSTCCRRAPPSPRTLIDILYDTAARYPDAAAIDDGTVQLTYSELISDIEASVAWLAARGIGRGDRIGIRMPSGSFALYEAILATLAAGAAYVPVDADDPDERAELVFGEANVVAVVSEAGMARGPGSSRGWRAGAPLPRDDAWIIFTSGSTGTPKGVAVTHRSAAAFVDAEAQMFLQDNPIGPGDRVLAGLSVAFDASCEEMWLAWRHGACLVPAPRSLVRSGMDLGPWLVSRDVTVVSTVPTLAALWPAEALEAVRLLIFGGEACPPELAARLAVDGREVWNTYGPTEATVVACAARLDGDGPGAHRPAADGLGPGRRRRRRPAGRRGRGRRAGDRRRRAGPLPRPGQGRREVRADADAGLAARLPQRRPGAAGQARAWSSGPRRRPGQGRRPSHRAGRGRRGAGAPARRQRRRGRGPPDRQPAHRCWSATSPAPTRTSTWPPRAPSSRERAARRAGAAPCPWSTSCPPARRARSTATRCPGRRRAAPTPSEPPEPQRHGGLAGRAVARRARRRTSTGPEADFFALGGGSLAAAQLVAALRDRYPQVTVADLYDHPRLGLARRLPRRARAAAGGRRACGASRPRGWRSSRRSCCRCRWRRWPALQWVTWLALGNNVARALHLVPWTVAVNWWWLRRRSSCSSRRWAGWRIAVLGARLLLPNVRPGTYRRGGSVHLRVWLAERLAEASGAENLAGAPWLVYYARALGAEVGKGVDLHSMPPVTGLLTLGHRSADRTRGGPVRALDRRRRVSRRRDQRSATTRRSARARTLLPGAVVGKNADVAPGSGVVGKVKSRQYWKGSPAVKSGRVKHPWPDERPARRTHWVAVYALTSVLLAAMPLIALAAGLAVIGLAVRHTRRLSRGRAARAAVDAGRDGRLRWRPTRLLTVVGGAAAVDRAARGLPPGAQPQRLAAVGDRAADGRRAQLPVPALRQPAHTRPGCGCSAPRSAAAPRSRRCCCTPKFTVIEDGAFLADDTMVASYELGGGWIYVATTTVGKRAFLGNSGITQPGRRVPDDGLVAVLSAAPAEGQDAVRRGWAARRCGCAGVPPRPTRPARSTPPWRLKAMRATRRVVPAGAGDGDRRDRARPCWVHCRRWHGSSASGAPRCAAGWCCWPRARSPPGVAVAAKWLLVGRIRAGEHPLWSSFVWRNEVADTFVETVAAPWFARAASGTPVLNLWLRALGAEVGRGAWCETYWLPEADLVTLGPGQHRQPGLRRADPPVP